MLCLEHEACTVSGARGTDSGRARPAEASVPVGFGFGFGFGGFIDHGLATPVLLPLWRILNRVGQKGRPSNQRRSRRFGQCRATAVPVPYHVRILYSCSSFTVRFAYGTPYGAIVRTYVSEHGKRV